MARVPEVLVVDQDPQARFELQRLIKQAQFNFAGEVGFGTEAVSRAQEVKPDIIICGLSAAPERSLQTIEGLLDILPETPLVAYGWQDDLERIRQVMLAGARDFLVMPIEGERLRASILSVLESEERKRLRLTGQTKTLGPHGLIIAIFAAKGGVGKTTLATNLGFVLSSEMSQSVVLVDADSSFGDVATMLDIKPEHTVIDLIRDIDQVERAKVNDYLTGPDGGLRILAAPQESLLWRLATPSAFRKALGLLSKCFDVVIIDTAGALSDLSIAALEEANVVLWITSSDFSSINNSRLGKKTLQQLSYPEERIRLVLNVNSSEDGVRPAKIEDALSQRFFWQVPYDRHLRLGAQVGRPAVVTDPTSPGARSIVALAHALMGAEPKPKAKISPLRRLLKERPPANQVNR